MSGPCRYLARRLQGIEGYEREKEKLRQIQTLICTCSEGIAPGWWGAASGFRVAAGPARAGSQKVEGGGDRSSQ